MRCLANISPSETSVFKSIPKEKVRWWGDSVNNRLLFQNNNLLFDNNSILFSNKWLFSPIVVF